MDSQKKKKKNPTKTQYTFADWSNGKAKLKLEILT